MGQQDWRILKILDIGVFERVGKDRAHEILKIVPFFLKILEYGTNNFQKTWHGNSWTSWIWHQYLSRNMTLKFCDFNTRELSNWFFYFQLRNGIFNYRNVNNWTFPVFNWEYPSTSQHSDSHPCTSPPLGGHEWTLSNTQIAGPSGINNTAHCLYKWSPRPLHIPNQIFSRL